MIRDLEYAELQDARASLGNMAERILYLANALQIDAADEICEAVSDGTGGEIELMEAT